MKCKEQSKRKCTKTEKNSTDVIHTGGESDYAENMNCHKRRSCSHHNDYYSCGL